MIDRRRALRHLAVLPAIASGRARAEAAKPAKKKGWAGGDAKLHALFGASWFYTWSPRTRPSKAIEFVPMIKGEWSLKQAGAIRSMEGISHLLGFNEPERAKQGNVSVPRALELWPRLSELAAEKQLRLGAPAPSSDQAGMAWLERFMEGAKRGKLKVDFVAVHWYRSRDPGEFEGFIKGLDRAYRLPIWVTEFNGWSGPEDEHYRFLRKSLEFLEKSRVVERYAYFNPGRNNAASLLGRDGSPNRLGELYRDAGN